VGPKKKKLTVWEGRRAFAKQRFAVKERGGGRSTPVSEIGRTHGGEGKGASSPEPVDEHRLFVHTVTRNPSYARASTSEKKKKKKKKGR